MLNSVFIAVTLMIILCLCRINVVISLFISALIGGVISGMSIEKIIFVFGKGIGNGAEIALSYSLLGGFAALISYSGITDYLVRKIIKKVNLKDNRLSKIKIKIGIIIFLLSISVMSQNLIPIHIAFIPIIIPPLISLLNDLRIDRRLIGLVIGFGLSWPYVLFPFGFGHIFHQIIQNSFKNAGNPIEFNMIWKALIIPSSSYIIGLILGLFVYRKHRNYKKHNTNDNFVTTELKPYIIFVTVLSILSTFIVQILTGSMIFGALTGVLTFFIFHAYSWSDLNSEFMNGIKFMAYIGIVMMIANGFSNVMNETGGINELVKSLTHITGDGKLINIIIMYTIGLIVTLGIGSSFATIPIITSLFIPMGLSIGLSDMALIALIGTSSLLGNSGSPVGESALGITSGLNIDGQHDHIKDTCIPNFLFYNIPLVIVGTIATFIL